MYIHYHLTLWIGDITKQSRVVKTSHEQVKDGLVKGGDVHCMVV